MIFTNQTAVALKVFLICKIKDFRYFVKSSIVRINEFIADIKNRLKSFLGIKFDVNTAWY